jgi:hypothetical protein
MSIIGHRQAAKSPNDDDDKPTAAIKCLSTVVHSHPKYIDDAREIESARFMFPSLLSDLFPFFPADNVLADTVLHRFDQLFF